MTGTRQVEDVLALSPLQEGFFALHRLAGADGIDPYSMQFVVDIDGPVDVDLLRRSAEVMLTRHPNLRAAFWDRDLPRPVQIIPAETTLPWSERLAAPTEFDAIARSERRRPFDLSRGPAIRVTLIAVPGETRRRLIFTAHHILVDGWGLAVFFTEMLTVYRDGGSPAGLPPVRPYRDYIGWLTEQDRASAFARWREYLGRVSDPLMVADGAVPAGAELPAKAELLLSVAETGRLRDWASEAGVTLSTAVLFGWAVVLHRIADRRDVVFGTVVSGRPERLSGVETMVGVFINAVPVVHRIDGAATVSEHCRQLQRELAAMRDVGYFSLSELQRDHGRGNLFDTLFVFENAPIDDAIRPVSQPDGSRFTPVQMESLTHYPLTVVAHLRGDALVLVVETIRAALPHLPPGEIAAMVATVLRQLPDCAEQTPDLLDIGAAASRTRCDDAVEPADRRTLWEVFEQQVHATPDAEALRTGAGDRYTYAELHSAATQLAGELAGRGVAPETVVALALPRSPRFVIAILAVLAAGGAYLPVDITLPESRIAAMLHRAKPVLAATETRCARLLPAGVDTVLLDDPAHAGRVRGRRGGAPVVRRHPDHAAYLIFTSGSTGEPKGVVGTNAALLSYFADHRDRVYRPTTARLHRKLRIAHAWSFSFDASWQPMVGLLDGHALQLFDADEMADADRLVHGIAEHGVDMIDTTPSMFVALRAAGLLDRPLTVLALGGEPIDAALWAQLRALPQTDVYNCYGPTEATVEAVVAPVHRCPSPTIGTPNTGTDCYVLDSALRAVPVGVLGELYLSGRQLARGYLGAAAPTAARFVADPARPGRRMYRTGDLVRRLPDGGYSYAGRADSQVKIRGYRVELGEVEAALRDHPAVADAAVSVVRRNGAVALAGFVVWRPDASADPGAVRGALAERLPGYMIPARIDALPRLPVNANGKLDGPQLNRLAADLLGAAGSGRARVASAGTETERTLCAVLADQFNGVVPHVDDDFFGLGLDSVVAISLVRHARRRGLTVSPKMVLTAPTIRGLAAAIDRAEDAVAEPGGDEHGAVPPLPVVTWLSEYGTFRRFTQTVLLAPPPDADPATVESVLQSLLDGHATLRSVLDDTADGPRLVIRPVGAVRAAELLTRVQLPSGTDAEFSTELTRAARAANEDIDPWRGAMLRAVWLCGTGRQLLLITAHHLVVDPVSWHILVGEIAEAWAALRSGATPKPLPEFTSYRRFARLLCQRAGTAPVTAQLGYWSAQVGGPDPALGSRHPDPARDRWSSLRVTPVLTPADATERLLARLGGGAGMREFLLAVTVAVIASWRRARNQESTAGVLVGLEGHGRADDVLGTDTANTVGWFNTMFPVRLGSAAGPVDVERIERNPNLGGALLDSVTAELATIPYDGLDYGLLRYAGGAPQLSVDPQAMFSYLGRLDLADTGDRPWSLVTGGYLDALPVDPEPDLPLRFAVHIGALVGVVDGAARLVTTLRWSDVLFDAVEIDGLADWWRRGVAALTSALPVQPPIGADRDG